MKKYTTYLIEDHEALRKLMKQMKSARLSDEKRDGAFKLFCDLLASHTVAEEKSLYKIRKENKWLRGDILEGLQEHREAEGLITKIKRTKNRELKDAKMKVLCDYTKHHLDEEEEKLFPHFEKTITPNLAKTLEGLYLDLRMKTQKKPTKISRGVL